MPRAAEAGARGIAPERRHHNSGVHKYRIGYLTLVLALLVVWTTSCQPARSATEPPTAPPLATLTPTSVPRPPLNPLTGLEVADPALLKMPAVLISISHFPATARPQSGLSFAPFVYEFYITEGATRFLGVFHGEWPEAEVPVSGGAAPRTGPFAKTGTLIGNRVWYDTVANGVQDPGEGGIAGLWVNLYDEFGAPLAQTTTDTNGFYGFSVAPGRYWVEFGRPDHLTFVTPKA